MSKMSTKEQAQNINKAITSWRGEDEQRRAQLVIDWCANNGIECCVSHLQLATAMKRMPYWSQGPDNYLDLAQAVTAAVGASAPSELHSRVNRLIRCVENYMNGVPSHCSDELQEGDLSPIPEGQSPGAVEFSDDGVSPRS